MYPPPAQLPPGSKVFAYLRDSGGAEQELSVERQIGEIQRWADQHGLIVSHYYADEARTGTTLKKRDQLMELIEHIRRGVEERGIVIWSYDRFARNAIHAQLYRSEIRSLGLVFHSLTDYIPTGSEGLIFEAFKDYAAEQFSERLSINVKSGLRAMVEKHKALPGFPPRGFKRVPLEIGTHRNGKPRIVHQWVADDDLVPMVQLAFEMRARGATLNAIMSTTKLFRAINSFKTFFNNRLYIGVLEFGDLIIEDYCEPIIAMNIWNKVQQVNQSRARIGKQHSPRRLGGTFLLSGLVHCQHCGSPLNAHVIAKPGKPRREYYVCSRARRRRDCPGREIPARALEAEIIDRLEDHALDLENLINFQLVVQDYYARIGDQLQGEQLRLRRDLAQQTKQIRNLVNAIAQRGASNALIDALHKAELGEVAIKKELEELEQTLSAPKVQTPVELRQLGDEIKAILRGDDIHQKKHALNMLTSRIIVSRNDASIQGVLYYIPVCVGGGTPAEVLPEGIQIYIPISRYTKAAR